MDSSSTKVGSFFRPLIFAAHPDDETIGAAGVLMRSRQAYVIYLTDGAPRDRNLRSPDIHGGRNLYAKARLLEAKAALAIAGVSADRIMCLGATDQEATWEMAARAVYLAGLLRHICPAVVITHSYEGGHPDHDSAALIARLALQVLSGSLNRLPDLLEMTSYHARDGHLVTAEFLNEGSNSSTSVELSAQEIRRKQLMLNSYQSQWRVLQSFDAGKESLRLAPVYDFMRPPHSGKLWYECLGWQMTGEAWRHAAAAAIAEVEHRWL
jgi:LmbE family N-acetylglucosaminyl deacetylase